MLGFQKHMAFVYILRQNEAIRFLKPKMKNKQNYKTYLNWSYEYLPRTPVGNTAMYVNVCGKEYLALFQGYLS